MGIQGLQGYSCLAWPSPQGVITEALLPSLMGSASASTVPILEPAGLGSAGHGGSSWQLLPEATLVAPSATSTWPQQPSAGGDSPAAAGAAYSAPLNRVLAQVGRQTANEFARALPPSPLTLSLPSRLLPALPTHAAEVRLPRVTKLLIPTALTLPPASGMQPLRPGGLSRKGKLRGQRWVRTQCQPAFLSCCIKS